MLSLNILEMLIVMTKITMMTAILMEVTVVDEMLTPNIVQNVFVINKRRLIIHVSVLCMCCVYSVSACLSNLTTAVENKVGFHLDNS